MNNMEELVFAFPTDELWKLLPYKEQGLIKGNSDVLKRIVQNGLFRKRSELEEDPSFKQIIPYAVIQIMNHFTYLRGDPGRQKNDYTINSPWE